jgi:hypothetical protein
MKIQAPEDPTTLGGITSTTNFKINATAKSFKILSSQIYTDKFGTAPRELGANAVDAHVAAGHNEPFEVHLPNTFEPEFSIRDYGTGMSRRKIETLYTTYFASDKNQDNDMIGGLGLGSKSPFCYAEQFTVVSFHNGKKFVYSAYLNNGLPAIAFIAEEDTKERNGMEISFAVRSADIGQFVARAKQIYSLFKVKPKVSGVANFKFEETKFSLESNGWALREMGTYNNGAIALMGNIGYPLSADRLQYSLDTVARNFLGLPFDIDFNIGDLEIVASRESLEYDDNTIKVLKTRITAIIAELQKITQDKFDACKTRYEAHCLYGDLFGYYSTRNDSQSAALHSLFKGQRFSWKGIPVTSDSITLFDDKTELSQDDITVTRFTYGYNKSHNYVPKTEDTIQIRCSKKANMAFYANDLNIGAVSRLRKFVKEQGDAGLMKDEASVFLLTFKTPDARKKFVKKMTMSDSDLKAVSILPKVIRIKDPKIVNGVKKVNVYNGGTSSHNSYNWTQEYLEFDPKATYYYVHLAGKDLDYNHYSGISMSDLNAMVEFLKANNVKHGSIYGFSSLKTVEKKATFVDFITFAKAKITSLITDMKLEKTFANFKEFKTVQTNNGYGGCDTGAFNWLYLHLKVMKKKRLTLKSKIVLDMMNKVELLETDYEAFRKAIPNFDKLAKMMTLVKFSQNEKPTHESESLKKDFYEKFPMLCYLNFGYSPDANQMKDVIHYIEKVS